MNTPASFPSDKKRLPFKKRFSKDQSHNDELIEPFLSDVLALECDYIQANAGTKVISRVLIVDFSGEIVLDSYVKVPDSVKTYCSTRKIPLPNEDSSLTFHQITDTVSHLIRNKIVVGYNVIKKLQSLKVYHAWQNCRDASKYYPFMCRRIFSQQNTPRSLEDLSLEYLDAPVGADLLSTAVASMQLYLKVKDAWDSKIAIGFQRANEQNQESTESNTKFLYNWSPPAMVSPIRSIPDNPWALDESDFVSSSFVDHVASGNSPSVEKYITSKFLL